MRNFLTKSFIITGANGSIGRELVSTFGISSPVLAIDISFDECCPPATSSNVNRAKIDLTVSNKELEETIGRFVKDNMGTEAVLINAAGEIHSEPTVNPLKGFAPLDIDTYSRIIRNNLTGTFSVSTIFVSQLLVNRMRGIIINFGSISANGQRAQSPYAAAKAGVRALTRVWAEEFGPFGIRVCEVSPGVVESKHTKDDLSDSQREQWISRSPLRRLTSVHDVVLAVKFCVECEGFHGRRLEVDSGLNY
jgi:3-oxoacyl-[acyl-carrier protein] reductase